MDNIDLLAKHGNVHEVLFFIREEWDGLTDTELEPLLERLYSLLLPPIEKAKAHCKECWDETDGGDYCNDCADIYNV